MLRLESGQTFDGELHGDQPVAGEVVFTTGMVGFEQSLTDPSFAGQILVFTYPLQGNYGVTTQWESSKIHAVGVVVSESCRHWSSHAGTMSLEEWCRAEGVPLLTGVDTRAVTKVLRDAGSMLGSIGTADFVDPNTRPLMEEVSVEKVQEWSHPEAKKRIILVDCGVKENILRRLKRYPIEIRQVPADYDYSEEEFDGIFLSNGPGNPEMATKGVEVLKKALAKGKPTFGICMGTQLMARAAGATTYKLKFGHRGQNQPCQEVTSRRCVITSQNHGYAVDGKSLPDGWEVSWVNLNDGSVEGIRHKEKPFWAVQFHPEAAPGPTDTMDLFDHFYEAL